MGEVTATPATAKQSGTVELQLPLTAAEELLFWTDRLSTPCLIYFRMRFAGQLRREAFDCAMRTALARHPLFRARVCLEPRATWEIFRETEWSMDWDEGPLGDDWGSGVRVPIGFYLRVTVDPVTDRSQLRFYFHHACADGLGIHQFTEDLLIAYANACEPGKNAQPLVPLCPEAFVARGRFGLNAGRLLKLVPKLAVGLLGVRQYLMRRPASLTGRGLIEEGEELPAGYPATEIFTFTVEETERLSRAPRENGGKVTLNDLLTRDLFRAVADWRTRHANARAGDWLRFMVPVNLRSPEAKPTSAANIVGLVFLDRQSSQIEHPDELLRGIHDEIALIKRNRLALYFCFSASLTRYLPGGLPGYVRQHRGLGMLLISNVGRLYEQTTLPRRERQVIAGNVVLEEAAFFPPHFPGMQAGFVISIYAGRLTLTLHYETRAMSPAQGKALLAGWVARLRESAGL